MGTKILIALAAAIMRFSLYAAFGSVHMFIYGVTGWILASTAHSFGHEGLIMVFIFLYIAAWVSLFITEPETNMTHTVFYLASVMRYGLCCGLIGATIALIMSDFDSTYVLIECYIGIVTGLLRRTTFDSQLRRRTRRIVKRVFIGADFATAYGAAGLTVCLFLGYVISTTLLSALLVLAIGAVYGFILGYRRAISKENPDS